MGLSHAWWSNRHWLIGLHFLFVIGYLLALALGFYIWDSFHFSMLELERLAGAYWFILFLPPVAIFAVSWLVSRSTPDELTRAGPAVELGRKDLQDRLEALCIAAGLPMMKLYLVDHEAFNALYWENEDDRRLYVTKGAYEGLSPEEIDCMMAHQLGRSSNGDFHIYPTMSLFIGFGTKLTSVTFVGAVLVGIKTLPLVFIDYAYGLGLYAVILSFGLLWLAFRYYGQYFGWCREFAADLFSIKLTKNALALASAIDKSKNHYYFPIVTEDLRAMLFINPDPGITLPWYRDPDERIEHLRAEIGAGIFTTS